MVRAKKLGPVARLGVRYGGTVRRRLAEIEIEMKKPHKCPTCGANAVKKVSVGLWGCRKCGYTFTGGAYTPSTKLGDVAKRATRRTGVSPKKSPGEVAKEKEKVE
jgi:large subunit ribosomal protein L37Ae